MSNINELTEALEPMALAHLNLSLLCDVYRSAYEEARHDGLVNWEAAASLAEENAELKCKLEAADRRNADCDTALCSLLPDCRYMDPPDGGSVTPLEQVARMVEDYREQLEVVSKSEWKLAGALTEAQMNNTVLEKRLKDAEKIINEQDQRLLDYAAIATKNAEKVAELEARALTVKLPDDGLDDCYDLWGEDHCRNNFDCGYNFSAVRHEEAIREACAAAGIKLQIEGE